MRNRGIGRARIFMGSVLLFAAVVLWATALLMSPHGKSVAEGTEHIRTVVTTFVRNSALGTVVLCALAGWMLFPPRRRTSPARDLAIAVVLAVLLATSVYQLFWIRNLLS